MSLFDRGLRCPREGCGGTAYPLRKDGRFYTHRGIRINVPKDFPIPNCDRCLKDVMTDAMFVDLTAVLETEYQKHAEMVRKILKRQKEAQ